MFNIGKAEEINYLNTINTYPVDELRINENINSQKNDLINSNDWSCQGLSGSGLYVTRNWCFKG